jgi:hypothetical protein
MAVKISVFGKNGLSVAWSVAFVSRKCGADAAGFCVAHAPLERWVSGPASAKNGMDKRKDHARSNVRRA